MVNSTSSFWSVQDEAEYIRQEQQRIKKMRDAAFSAGFEAGAAWGISRGIRETARVFEKTADSWNEFPPDLVKAFAASMTELAPEFEKIIIAGAKEARAEATTVR